MYLTSVLGLNDPTRSTWFAGILNSFTIASAGVGVYPLSAFHPANVYPIGSATLAVVTKALKLYISSAGAVTPSGSEPSNL